MQSNDSVRYVSAYKRPSEADSTKWVTSDYFATPWTKLAAELPRQPLPTALDLDGLYEKLLAPVLPLAARPGEGIRAQVERVCEAKKFQRDITRLENRLRKEKQFNRKVEINLEINDLKEQLITFEA